MSISYDARSTPHRTHWTEKVPGFCRKQKIYKRLDMLRADRVSGNQNVDVFDKPFDVVACLGYALLRRPTVITRTLRLAAPKAVQ
jgi:hypothetical protein